ncbi:MAG: pantoate--beta-alanine ligase [Chloroflexota bacterium]|nr:pantoate--beta-alanine ligase [Chloroflexota bacterium]
MKVIQSIAETIAACRAAARPLGLAPTMGYLHEGHAALARRASQECATVAASIFVNPTQFGPSEDFASYPRSMERDLAMLEAAGTDIVFAPTLAEMYPPGFDTWVEVGALTQRLEGAIRPGHFRGVCTVVAKLFTITRPDRAYFGRKDGQQLAVIRKMAADLHLGVEIVPVDTVREPDGLAMSSRNVYLTQEQRRAAPVIYRALSHVRELYQKGERNAERLRLEGRRIIEAEPLVKSVDYFSIADAATLEELDIVDRPALVSTTARIGRARLIDNVLLG